MIFDLNATFDQQTLQSQALLSQINAISVNHLFASQEDIDELRQFLYSILFDHQNDSLYGGFFLIEQSKDSCTNDNRFSKPLYTNLLLAEILFQSNQVLYDSEINFCLTRLTTYLRQILSGTPEQLCEQRFYSQNQLLCYFDIHALERVLDSHEKKLLFELVDYKKENALIYSLRHPLSQAAEQADLPLKQAQFLWESIEQKLRQLNLKRTLNFETIPLAKDEYFAIEEKVEACQFLRAT